MNSFDFEEYKKRSGFKTFDFGYDQVFKSDFNSPFFSNQHDFPDFKSKSLFANNSFSNKETEGNFSSLESSFSTFNSPFFEKTRIFKETKETSDHHNHHHENDTCINTHTSNICRCNSGCSCSSNHCNHVVYTTYSCCNNCNWNQEICRCSNNNRNHYCEKCGSTIDNKKMSTESNQSKKSEQVKVSVDVSETLKSKFEEKKSSTKKQQEHEEIHVDIDIIEKKKSQNKTEHNEHHHGHHHEHMDVKIPYHPNYKNPQPIQAQKCRICKFFCYGICSIPFNPNARFKNINFRLYPDYDFLDDDYHIKNNYVLIDSGDFPRHSMSSNEKRFKIKLYDAKRMYTDLKIDIIGNYTVISGKRMFGYSKPPKLTKRFTEAVNINSLKNQNQKNPGYSRKEYIKPDNTIVNIDIDIDERIQNIGNVNEFRKVYFVDNALYELERANSRINPDGDLVLIIPLRKDK
ncbi:hypothetical protein BB559_006285 [Furculomyces boomerangus]|uniref:Uncharacterized protein n=1 Tax=Furculomyces boomerangus TaxID=61424 RepID=A0A2T9Y3T3_9FUNG|nr:hypothetical protein BB559_006285 [Furculomyces boomerangus]